jgi:putative methionine-R-sulfoxide reductase with GAF domain
MPSFDHESISSVLLMFFQNNGDAKGAVELWGSRPGTHELSLLDGYYVGLPQFSLISRYMHMPYGSGLPGLAWKYGAAQLLNDINHAQTFLRSSSAESEGLSTGLAIPVINYHQLTGVVTFLSTSTSPMGKVYEIWKPGVVHNKPALIKFNAHYGAHSAFEAASSRLTIQPGEGIIGNVWASRRPVIIHDLNSVDFIRGEAARTDGLRTAMAIPSMLGDAVYSICLILW